jgi:DNA-binding GntR family transcriptional regulator
MPKADRKRTAAARRLRLQRIGLHEEAAIRLRKLIVRGDLAPGVQLNEAALSQALGVSRTPLREAIKLLAAEGLIELRRNRSPVVTSLSRSEVGELFEAASGMERLAAELAATRMTSRDLQKLADFQLRMERHHQAGELRDYFEINQQVHGFIVDCARNSVLKAVHEQLLARVERARFFALSSAPRWDESAEEHRQILCALEARDAVRAGELLARHVRRTGEVVADFIHAAATGKDRPPGGRQTQAA